MSSRQSIERSGEKGHEQSGNSAQAKVRIDKWLWAARFFKTRTLAAQAIDGGKVDVNDERAKRSRHVQEGDRVSLRQGPVEWVVIVRGVAERRGSAEIARTLYEETAAGKRRREVMQEQLRSMPTAFAYGKGKPGKQDRRALRKLKGED